ncbi:hypothetical protein IIA16_01690 [bacterium]|nr:hypothetical protein [bacterium]
MNKPSIVAALVLSGLAMVATKNFNSSKSNTSGAVMFVQQGDGDGCNDNMKEVSRRGSSLCIAGVGFSPRGHAAANARSAGARRPDALAGASASLPDLQKHIKAKAGATDYVLVSFGTTIAWFPLDGFPLPETEDECEEAKGEWLDTGGGKCLLRIGLSPAATKDYNTTRTDERDG